MNNLDIEKTNGYGEESSDYLRMSIGLAQTQTIMPRADCRRPEVSKHESQLLVTQNNKMTPLIDTVKTIENSLVGQDDELDQQDLLKNIRGSIEKNDRNLQEPTQTPMQLTATQNSQQTPYQINATIKITPKKAKNLGPEQI